MKKTTIAILFLLFVSLFAACSADAVSGQYDGSGIVNNSGYAIDSSSSSEDPDDN